MKRLKKIGLTQAYQNEETTQAVFCCLLALPVTDIDPAFQDVKVLVHDDTLSKTLLLQLCRYVERQWLNKSSIGAAIPHALTTLLKVFTRLCDDV